MPQLAFICDEKMEGRLRAEAEREGRTLSQYVKWVLTQWFARKDAETQGDSTRVA